jgi:hypothetical protein
MARCQKRLRGFGSPQGILLIGGICQQNTAEASEVKFSENNILRFKRACSF